MSWSVGDGFRTIITRLAGDSGGHKTIPPARTERSSFDLLFLSLSDQMSRMAPAEAQSIVMDFSGRLARQELPRVVVRCALFPDGKRLELGAFSRVPLPYSKERAVCAFRSYYVQVCDPDTAKLALSVLNGWVVRLLSDELAEPLTLDDVDRDIALRDELSARLASEQEALDGVRLVNQMPPSALSKRLGPPGR